MPSTIGITASAVFTPLDIPGLLVWLDAADSSTITVSSGRLTQWADKSAAARLFSQGSTASQPSTGSQTLNGLNVIVFDGNDFLTYDAGSDALDLSPVSWWAVVRFASTTGTFSRIFGTKRSATVTADFQSPNSCANRNNADAVAYSTSGTATPNVAYTADVFSIYHGRADGSNAYLSSNNGSEVSSAASAPANQRYIRIGAAVFGNTSAGDGMTGRIAEIIMANVDANANTNAAVLNYLNNKWAIY